MIGRRVLVVAAHPDDEVLGVGGTIPRIVSEGATVDVVIVTDGSSSQYQGDSETQQRKQSHAKQANEGLGVERLWQWDFPDMRLDQTAHIDLNRSFEALIAERQFDTVFVQNRDDVNLDHKAVYDSVLVATRPTPEQPVNTLLAYPVNSSTEWGGRTQQTVFCPNFYVDISSTIEQKLSAMEVYQDELRPAPHPRSLEAIRARAAVYGSEVGRHYAEAFKLLVARSKISSPLTSG